MNVEGVARPDRRLGLQKPGRGAHLGRLAADDLQVSPAAVGDLFLLGAGESFCNRTVPAPLNAKDPECRSVKTE